MPLRSSNRDAVWEQEDKYAAERAGGIDTAIEYAQSNVEWEGVDNADYQNYVERVGAGADEWDRLRKGTCFDLRGVFRRRPLVPFVLIPRKVAARYGSAGNQQRAEKQSLLENLQQAHDAFVFGVPYAALALMRSIAEGILRDHYRVEGKNLSARIENAPSRLPRGVTKAALHRLRKRVNAILHLGREEDEKLLCAGEVGPEMLPILDEIGLEKEIVSLLYALRALIEGVK